MSWIAATDPLALLAIQAGQVGAPTQSTAPQNATDLTAAQRFVQIGEPVPVVFARFRNNKGGILVSPGATEARFQNDANNNTTFYYHLAISEGSIASIPVKDVFQGLSRVGSHTQTYNRRAGTWIPGNFITPSAVAEVQFTFDDLAVPVDSRVWYNATYVNGVWRFIYNGTDYTFGTGVNGVRNTIGADLPLAVAPYFCGTVGAYPGISTLSFAHTTPNASDLYRQQVHLFIRGGVYVTRIYDSVVGPTDNFADIVKWLLLNTARVPADLLDNAALLKAATFLEYNSFTCNCEIKNSLNYSDFVTKWAPYFLLGQSSNNGKRGLRPLLPTTSAGAIITTAVTPEYVFTESDVIAGSLEIDYIPLADRLPFVVQVIWRQQIESDIGVIRTAELRFTDTADVGPYEAHDLSEFCTNEDHAVKVGAYILAKRVYVTHTVRFTARPQAHTTIIGAGDIVALTMPRNPTGYAASVHSYLYQIERINKTLAGDVTYEATHFPVDDAQQSLVALAVANASGTGISLTSNRTGANLDFNSSSDNTIPTEEFTEVAYEDPTNIGFIGNQGAIGALPGNETDNYDNNGFLLLGGLIGDDESLVNKPLTTNSQCAVQWYRDGVAIPGATGNTYTPTAEELGAQIRAIDNCGGSSGSAQVVGYDPEFSQNGGIKANVTIRRFIKTYWKTNCSTNTIQPTIEDISTTFYLEFKQIKTYTADVDGYASLPNTMSYSIACNAGTGTNYRINGGYEIKTPNNYFVTNGYWGNNITLSANQGLTSLHSTIITSIVLTEANPAYGNIGDNVLDLGILEAVSSGASFWTKGTVIT